MPLTETLKVRLPDDMVDALILVAQQRQTSDQINVSALIRTILTHEVTKPAPPPVEAWLQPPNGPVCTIRMSNELLEAIERVADAMGEPELSPLVRFWLRRWLQNQNYLPGRVRKRKETP